MGPGADNHNCIQTYLDLYDLEPSPNKLPATADTLRRMVDTTKIERELAALAS